MSIPQKIVDSDTTERGVNILKYFQTLQMIPNMRLEQTGVTSAYITDKGSVNINRHGRRTILKEMYYVPKLSLRLLSCSKRMSMYQNCSQKICACFSIIMRAAASWAECVSAK